MERFDTTDADGFFEVVGGTDRSQAATMTVAPGESTGGSRNAHGSSDQWLYVVSGTGTATVDGQRYELRTGTLLLVEAGETHEIANRGGQPLETINVYAPPEY